ncbi:MAG: hypothetical protein PHD65_12110 [Gallionella sp.]|nr:hypothetical protein [Gallionella sp.]
MKNNMSIIWAVAMKYRILLDATQDDCPVAIIKIKEMLDKIEVGAVLKVVTSKQGRNN